MNFHGIFSLLVLGSLLILPLRVVAQNADLPPEEMFKVGAAAFQEGKYDEAAKNFEAVLGAGPTGDALDTILFTLGTKHTDCLAKEICLPNPQESSSCCSGTGCC